MSDPNTILPETLRLLAHLHRGGAHAYWWAVKDGKKQTIWWQPGQPKPLLNSQHNMYFGVHPSSTIPTTNSKGESVPPSAVRSRLDTVAATNCVFAEFDAKDFILGKHAALEHVVQLDPPPSVIIDSGGGYHCYWLFDEPFVITSDDDRRRAELLQKGWVKRVGSDDASKDLARVLRVPGTQNFKPEYGPGYPTVTFMVTDWDTLYTIDALEALVAAEVLPDTPVLYVLPSAMSTDDARLWALGALQGEHQKMLGASAGQRHRQRLNAARALGGLVPHITEQEIFDALAVNFGNDQDNAEQTIRDGIAYGKQAPRHIPERPGTPTPIFDADGVALCPTHKVPLVQTRKRDAYRCPAPKPGEALCFWWKGDGYTPPVVDSPASDDDVPAVIDLGPDLTPEEWQALVDYRMTDAGNAESLRLLHGAKLRYCHTRAKWLVWDSTRWRIDGNGAAQRATLEVARQRQRAAGNIIDPDARKRAWMWGMTSESNAKRVAMLVSAQSVDPFTTEIDQYDQHPMLAPVTNGTLDLMTSTLRSSDPEDYLTMQLGTRYDGAATCPRWRRFLSEVFGGDDELISYVQRAVGYSLTADTREQKLFLCHGGGANGKSVFLEILSKLLGDYAGNASFDTFDAGKRDQATNDLAALKGKRLVTVIETDEDRRLAEARVKAVTGQDPISCRFLYGEFFHYRPTYKIWLAMNHKPVIRGTDRGIWRRIQLIPFMQSFEGREDKVLTATLEGELPGILNWALEGLDTWHRVGLGTAAAIEAATREYQKESDLVAQWMEQCVELHPTAFTSSIDGRLAYAAWCKVNGYREPTESSFSRRLNELGFPKLQPMVGGKRQRGYVGFRILPFDEQPYAQVARVTSDFGGSPLNNFPSRGFTDIDVQPVQPVQSVPIAQESMEWEADQTDETPSVIPTTLADAPASTAYLFGTRWKAIWHNRSVDTLVIVCGRWPGEHTDGRHYYQIDGSATSLPVDEVELVEQLLPDEPDTSPHDHNRINEIRQALAAKNLRSASRTAEKVRDARLRKQVKAEVRAVQEGWPAWTPSTSPPTGSPDGSAPGVDAEDVPIST